MIPAPRNATILASLSQQAEESWIIATVDRSILDKLLADDKDAADLAKSAKDTAAKACKASLPDESAVGDQFACPGWVPAEGFGINGSYGYSVRVLVTNNTVVDRNVIVTLSPGVGNLGTVILSGKARLIEDGKQEPLAEFLLTPAWFDTIGTPGAVSLFAQKGTMVVLPQNSKVSLEVTLNPSVKTDSGTVPLWECTRSIKLK